MVWGNIKNVLLDAFFCDVLKLWSIKIEGDSTTFAGLNKFVKFFSLLVHGQTHSHVQKLQNQFLNEN